MTRGVPRVSNPVSTDMPTVNDEFNRTCVRLDLDPERSGIFAHDEVALLFSEDDLRVFNRCVGRIAPGTRAVKSYGWRLVRRGSTGYAPPGRAEVFRVS